MVVDLPRCGPILSPRVPNLVPIPGPRMERETPGQRPRPNYGHPHPLALIKTPPSHSGPNAAALPIPKRTAPARHSRECNPPTKRTQPNTGISTYRDIPNTPSTAHVHERINTPRRPANKSDNACRIALSVCCNVACPSPIRAIQMNPYDGPTNTPGVNSRGQTAPPPSRNSSAAATPRVMEGATETEPGPIGAQTRSLSTAPPTQPPPPTTLVVVRTAAEPQRVSAEPMT